MRQRTYDILKHLSLAFLLAPLAIHLVSCQQAQPPQPQLASEYETGVSHGNRIAAGLERDYELVIYIHDNIIGDDTKEKNFRNGFVAGYTETQQGKEAEAEEAVALAIRAASSFEYDHGLEIAEKLVDGTISDVTARVTMKVSRSLVDELALKAGFIKGYGEGGEAMYYGLIR